MQKIFVKNRRGFDICVAVNEIATSKGLAFIMHGLGGFKEQNHIQLIADTFEESGYSTVLFDTTNSIGESGGEYEKATMTNYYEDLEDVIAWSKAQSWYKAPFFLAGHSLGGYSVIRFAEENPELIKGVFAFAPVVSGKLSFEAHQRFHPEELDEWEKEGAKTRVSNSKPGLEMKLLWSHMTERLNHNLLSNIHNITMPIMIIVGEKDESCPPDHQQILFDAIPSIKKELVVVKDAPHTFRAEEHAAELKNQLTNWLNKF